MNFFLRIFVDVCLISYENTLMVFHYRFCNVVGIVGRTIVVLYRVVTFGE